MKANRLLKENIDALLRRDRLNRKDLAQWCYNSESWISKIYREDRRGFSIKDLDRIADLFGLQPYQLFQPGIGDYERRTGSDRRTVQERRMGQAQRVMLSTAAAIDPHRPARKGVHVAVVASSPKMVALAKLTAEYERRVSALLSQAEFTGETATSRKALPATRARGGAVRGPDTETS